MIVCFSTHIIDPVFSHLREKEKIFPERILTLTLEEFLSDVTVNDVLTPEFCRIDWCGRNGRRVHSDHVSYFVNRFLGLDDFLFQKFAVEDREYAKRELNAYFAFAFNGFKRSSAKSSPGGLCGDWLSLPEQWEKIKNRFGKEISVPQYRIGKNDNSILPQEWIRGRLYDGYRWRQEDNKESFENKMGFHYKRPAGNPVVLLHCRDQIEIESFGTFIAADTQDKLKSLTKEIAKDDSNDFCEILYFVDEDLVTYGFSTPLFSNSIPIEKVNGMLSRAFFPEGIIYEEKNLHLKKFSS